MKPKNYYHPRTEQLLKKGLRKCFCCKQILKLNLKNFYPDNTKKHRGNGFSYDCRKCSIERRKKYKYKYTKRLRFRFNVLQRDNFACQYCGRKAPEVILEVDHIYPKSKGGKDKMENFLTSCRDCNRGKLDLVLNGTNRQLKLMLNSLMYL